MQIETAGELRTFLADVMVGIKEGTVEAKDAMAITKVAAQINQSLAVEVNTALQLEKLGKGGAEAGSMRIGSAVSRQQPQPVITQPKETSELIEFMGDKWCDQCDDKIAWKAAKDCKSPYCSIKKAAA